MIKIRPTWDFYVRCGLALAAFAFILYRVFSVDFIGDEWGMWHDSIEPGLKALLTFQHKDPQSHFLQALVAIPCLRYLPVARITAIRLPSLVLFILYAITGFLATGKLKNAFNRILFFAAWIGPEIVLEYFGLARGYAFLLGFGSFAYYGLVAAYDPAATPDRRDLWTKLAAFSAALAMLALLTFAYGFMLIAILLLLRYALEAGGSPRNRLAAIFRHGGFVIACGLLLFVFYLPRYLILKDHPAMQWGGKANFVADSFNSLVACITYIDWSNVAATLPIALALLAVILLDLVLVLVQARVARMRSVDLLRSPLALVGLLFVGFALSAQLGFWFFDVQFPVRRAVLYLWPLVILVLGFSLEEIRFRPIRWLNVAALVALLAFYAHSYNLVRTYEYQQDAQNKEIARVLYDLAKERAPSDPLIVGMTDWLRYTIWYYYEEEYSDMPVAPQLKDHPIFRLHGDKLLTYSLNYAIAKKVPRWHIHPRTDYYLLQGHYEGDTFTTPMDFDYTIPPPRRLMDLEPVRFFPHADVTLFKARPGVSTAGCDRPNCPICQILPQLPAAIYQPAP